MGKTGITTQEETRDRLRNYRHPDHDSWDDVLNGMMDLLPAIDAIQDDGCVRCGETPFADRPTERLSGFIHFFTAEIEAEDGYREVLESNYYDSRECVTEAINDQEKFAARNPDLVVVGGKHQYQTELHETTFHLEQTRMEVGFDIPGAFDGESAHGTEYDYIGEPVFVKNHGDWVHSGIISDIIHEEGHTSLILDHSVEARFYHPVEEKREEERENWADWRDGVCPECGFEFRYVYSDPNEECPDCGAEIDVEEYDADDSEPGVPPWESE